MGPWVVCRATLQALSTLFGQFLEEEFSEVRTQRVLEGLVFALRQTFFDREYDPFRQHEL
jgi:hypothetical protein